MPQWQLFWPWQSQELQFATTVNMGGGRVVNSVDIVDGHAQRLSEASANDLTSAIRVVAPQLAPLTDLAQEIADRSTKSFIPQDKPLICTFGLSKARRKPMQLYPPNGPIPNSKVWNTPNFERIGIPPRMPRTRPCSLASAWTSSAA